MDALQEIVAFREKHELSEAQLASSIGKSQGLLWLIRAGRRRPSVETADELADFMASKGWFGSREKREQFVNALLRLPLKKREPVSTP